MNISSESWTWLDRLKPLLPLPLWQKIAGLGIVMVLILAAYYFFGWMPAQEEISSLEQRIASQKKILERNKILAKDLPRKKQEYEKLVKQLRVALNILPKKSQIPDLLESVSWAGKDSGLEFSIFKPLGEVQKDIYAEVPVDLEVSGTYRQLMVFLKRVGEMPRIVNIQNLSLTQPKAGSLLVIKGKAITYRFIEKSEQKKARKKKG